MHDLIVLASRLDVVGIGLVSVQEKIDTNSSGGRLVTEVLGTKPGETKALFRQTLDADRMGELKEQMLVRAWRCDPEGRKWVVSWPASPPAQLQ